LLTDLSQSSAAQVQLRAAIALLTSALGNQHALLAEARADLGRSLADSGRYAEAETELKIAQELGTRWAPPDTWTAVRPRFFTALMQLQKDEPAKAEIILADIVAYSDSNKEAYYQRHKESPQLTDSTGPVRQALGEAYARQGKLVEAIAALQGAIKLGELAEGPLHPTVISTRLALAEVLLAQRRDSEAQNLLVSIPATELTKLPPVHPILGQWHRVDGLLALRQNNTAEARKSLNNVLEIYRALYGAKHWRTIRANQELLLTASKDAS
jgi:tetratricopeptide (TPR) repeat protein